ncbi:MAG: hypothetical protein AB1706_18070 [Pseudomonadota bacterium]
MLKLIIGIPQKCREWVSGASNDADYTNAWDMELVINETLDNGSITTSKDEQKSIMLLDALCPAEIKKDWQLFFVDATLNVGGDWDINEVIFGGIITGWPKEAAGKDTNGLINFINVQASSFEKELERLTVKQQTRVNQWSDVLMKSIRVQYTDSFVVRDGTLERPPKRVSVARFNNERTALSALKAIAALDDETHELIFTPVLSASFSGVEITFREIQKQYAPVILDETLRELLGPKQCTTTPSTVDQKNIVTLPFWVEEYRDSERHLQISTTSEAELNSRVSLSGIPSGIESCTLYQDYFGSDVKSELIAENDLSNPYPPEGHLSEEGYLLQGEINFVQGFHFLEASSESPVWGQIARISDPDDLIFEPKLNTQLRIKEMTVSTRGEAILCAYYDISEITSVITNVVSASVFDVEDGTKFNSDMLVVINDETKIVDNVNTNRVTLKSALSQAPEANDVCYVSNYNKSRVIFGLETTADGTLYVVENGVSTLLSNKTYNEETIYTIRNHCNVYETWTTSESSTATFEVNDLTGFSANDISELFASGNDKTPVEVKVQSINSGAKTITLTATQGTIPTNTKIRTKTKPKLQINGGGTPIDSTQGKYDEASGKSWTDLAEMENTFQSEINKTKEIGFSIIMQKTLEGTIKEFKACNYPEIDLIINGKKKVISTPDDSAEKDIDAFINARNERYFIELPTDTKTEWESESVLEVRYKEKRQREIQKVDFDSLYSVAEERGNPILESDSFETMLRKGGKTALPEECMSNSLT